MPAHSVQWLRNNHDLARLEIILRNRTNPALRIEAAEALGSLGDVEAVEPLARAVLQDPDPEVQKSARLALADLIGGEANTVLATYRHHLSATGQWHSSSEADKDDEEYLQDSPSGRQETITAESYEGWEEPSGETDQSPQEDEWDQQN